MMYLPIHFIIISILISPLWWTVAHTRAITDVFNEDAAAHLKGKTGTNVNLQNDTLLPPSGNFKRAPIPPLLRGRPKHSEPDTTWNSPEDQQRECKYPRLTRRFNLRRGCDDDKNNDNNKYGYLKEGDDEENRDPEEPQAYVERGARIQAYMNSRLVSFQTDPSSAPNKGYSKIAFGKTTDATPNDGGYKLEPEEEMYPSERRHLDPTLEQFDLDKSTTFHARSVRGAKFNEEVSRVYTSDPGSKHGIMVATSSFLRHQDGKYNRAPENQRITQWSELTHQMLTERYGPDSSSMPDIKYVIQDSIENRATRIIIASWHKDFSGRKIPGTLNGRQGSWVSFDAQSKDPTEGNAVRSILGTPNGNGVGYLLADYPSTFGGKTIRRIHTWHSNPDDDDKNNEEGEAEMLFDLEPFE